MADGDNLHDIDAEGEPDDYEDGKPRFCQVYICDLWTRHSHERNTSPLILVSLQRQ